MANLAIAKLDAIALSKFSIEYGTMGGEGFAVLMPNFDFGVRFTTRVDLLLPLILSN